MSKIQEVVSIKSGYANFVELKSPALAGFYRNYEKLAPEKLGGVLAPCDKRQG